MTTSAAHCEPGNFLDAGESSDEDNIYDTQPAIPQRTNHMVNLHMYEIFETDRTSSTKSTFYSNQTSHRVYENTRSSCTVAVDRLVLIDGWKGEPDANGHDEAMTLVVLRLALGTEGFGTRLTYASLQLKLKAATKNGADPQLVAWGPFRRPEMWNITDTHKRTNVTPSVKFSGGFAGQNVSVGIKRDAEQTWDERFTDYGTSMARGDAKKSRPAGEKNDERVPNAVLWQVFENGRLKRGITHEIRVAAIFSRPGVTKANVSTDKYLVSVKVSAHISGARESARRIFRLGQDGSDTIIWPVGAQVGSTDRCYAEGRNIVSGLDLDRLGKLTDPNDCTNLDPTWLNKWDRVETSSAESLLVKPSDNSTPATNTIGIASESKLISHDTEFDVPKVHSIHVETAGIDSQETIEALTDVITNDVANNNIGYVQERHESDKESNWDSNSEEKPDTDSSLDDKNIAQPSEGVASAHRKDGTRKRLVSLEKRAAQVESRIALQDQRIFELQQTLARVSQALLGPTPMIPKKARMRRGKGPRRDNGK